VDHKKAIHYYTAAAEQDHSDAVTNLGKWNISSIFLGLKVVYCFKIRPRWFI
jgi:TPR repeat protein